MVVVCVADEFCAAAVAVRLQAGLAEGELWANATPDMATPIASEAEKINRDMDILLISMPRWRGTLTCGGPAAKTMRNSVMSSI